MLTVVLSWLGGSVIWLVPLMVLQIAQLALRRGASRAQGTLRVWVGAVFAYAASASFEALVTAGIAGWPHGGVLGRALAELLTGTIGHPLSISVSVLALLGALPLYIKGMGARLSAVLEADQAASPSVPRSSRTSPPTSVRPGLALPTGRGRSDGQRLGTRGMSVPGTARKPGPQPRAAAAYKKEAVGRSARALAKSAPYPGPVPRAASPALSPTGKPMPHKALNSGLRPQTTIANSANPNLAKPAASSSPGASTAPRPVSPPRSVAPQTLEPSTRREFVRDVPAEPKLDADWYEPVPAAAPSEVYEPVLPEQINATLEAIARRASEWTALSRGAVPAAGLTSLAETVSPAPAIASPAATAPHLPMHFDTVSETDRVAAPDLAGDTAPIMSARHSGLDNVIDALAQEVAKPLIHDLPKEIVATAPTASIAPIAPIAAACETSVETRDTAARVTSFETSPQTRAISVTDQVAAPWEAAANETLLAAPAAEVASKTQAGPLSVASVATSTVVGNDLALAATVAAEVVTVAPPPGSFTFTAPLAMTIELPPVALLARATLAEETVSEQALLEKGQLIEQRLKEFKVPVSVIGADAGPVITRFEIEPAVGVRGSQIVGLMKDLSRALGVTSVRVVETIPGKTCMGLELPNAQRQMIRLSEILESDAYRNHESHLTMAMGKDITGNPVVADLAKAPHMLVAGTTGSGKSVAINAMILSLLYKATPEEVRMIMIDPKMLELSVYEGIPHLLAPVVTDMKLAAHALNWCVGEMERRYRLLSALGVRNLAGYNQKIRSARQAEKYLTNPFSLTPDAPEPLSTLPLIVVVIDELADLMMVAGKKIEELIARLAQKARAAGIHLILATQRPSVDVITGLIKANIPTRVAFQVSSKIDSRTILDQMGAESLLGQGDMLFLPPGTGYPQRVHGAFVADEEVHRVVEYLKQFGEPEYEESILAGAADDGAGQDLFGETPDVEADPLYDEAVAFVLRSRRASISSVQRQFRIGYNRAARLVEQMEGAGLVSSMSNGGTREVLVPGPSD